MEISNALLVAIMFVILLSLGIGTLLAGLAITIARGRETGVSRIHVSWLILMLLVYFNLFWHTLDVLGLEEWGFAGFLYIVTGPILLFFATTILVPDGGEDSSGGDAGYLAVSRPFFLTLALAQVWIIGSDFVLGKGLTGGAAFNAIVIALALLLASTRSIRVHTVGATLAWVLFLSAITLSSLGLIT